LPAPCPCRRRDFLKITAVVASAVPLPGCGSEDGKKQISESAADRARVYPQGLASGDPRPDSIILWTRVAATDGSSPMVKYELAKDEAFSQIVASGEQAAEAAADNTLKLKVTALEAGTQYYYRFTALDVRSVTGHTKTAPADGTDTPVRFAFATCQDFIGRYYHSWRALLEKTQTAPVDFVV
jgi:alkaline phosphatase D